MNYWLRAVDRIAAKSAESPDGCWVFHGATTTNGYGVIGVLDNGKHLTRHVHRVAYRVLRSEIPEGLQLDHLCRNRLCWNPDHLDPVTHRENGMRGAAPTVLARVAGVCMKGHPQTPGNFYQKRNGHRQCAVCARATAKERRSRK
jgi:hypothetical protein